MVAMDTEKQNDLREGGGGCGGGCGGGGAVTAVSVLPLMSRRSPDSERCSFLFLQSGGDLVPVSVPGQNLIWINGATAAPDTQLGHIAFSALRPRKPGRNQTVKSCQDQL